MSANEKGNALERAVHAIEHAILRGFPGYSEAAFRISRRKIIVVDGVRHEYDVWVELDLAPGYEPLFVFECKNWEAKVGKNEIIVFSEKIAAAKAQKGYFVAPQFTAAAVAQAAKDARIELLTAQELPTEAALIMENFHMVGIDNQQRLISISPAPEDGHKLTGRSLNNADARLNGEPVDLEQYASAWADELRENHSRTYPSNRLADGVYPIELKDTRSFGDGELTIESARVLKLALTLTFDVHIAWPRIKTSFDVATRGRAILCEPIDVPGAHFEFAAVGVSAGR